VPAGGAARSAAAPLSASPLRLVVAGLPSGSHARTSQPGSLDAPGSGSPFELLCPRAAHRPRALRTPRPKPRPAHLRRATAHSPHPKPVGRPRGHACPSAQNPAPRKCRCCRFEVRSKPLPPVALLPRSSSIIGAPSASSPVSAPPIHRLPACVTAPQTPAQLQRCTNRPTAPPAARPQVSFVGSGPPTLGVDWGGRPRLDYAAANAADHGVLPHEQLALVPLRAPMALPGRRGATALRYH
jgi:hypothetical protein